MILSNYNEALQIITDALKKNKKLTIGIDGRSASGKTTFAAFLQTNLPCNVFHADDFFLRPSQRTAERLDTPGGNFDIERFNEEVVSGILSGEDFIFTPFDCKKMELSKPVKISKSNINIIEGSYSCHPYIKISYDITFFLTISPEKQKERIISRNKERAEMFFTKWIPLEEKYFSAYNTENNCDHVLVIK